MQPRAIVCALLATQIPVLPEEIVVEVRAHFQMLSAWLVSVFERGLSKVAWSCRAMLAARQKPSWLPFMGRCFQPGPMAIPVYSG